MQTNTFLATLLTVVLGAGCDSDTGDDDSSTTAPLTTTMTPTSTPTSGDEDTMATTATTGGGGEVVNGCDPAMAVDMTGMAEVVINQVALTYTPACIKISAGTSVKFTADFVGHPLVGGIVDGTKMPDAASPILATSTGTEASFTIANAGTYGYYCDFHALSGMFGAIIAE